MNTMFEHKEHQALERPRPVANNSDEERDWSVIWSPSVGQLDPLAEEEAEHTWQTQTYC